MLTAAELPANTTRIVGFDTIQKLDRTRARALALAGLAFAMRYVPLGDAAATSALDPVEVDAITGAGLALGAVQYARTGAWSQETGAADGAAAAHHALAAGLPPDTTLWCDLEGALPSADVAIAYAVAWFLGATSVGFDDPGLYVGGGVPLSDSQLRHALPFRRYWRSLSAVPNVLTRGYQLVQLYPPNQTIAGVPLDLNVVQSDYLGGRPRFAKAA